MQCILIVWYVVNKLLFIFEKYLQGEDHLERRDAENLHSQMINGEDRPHPTETTPIISPLTTIENEKEMTEEVKMIGNLKWLLDYTAKMARIDKIVKYVSSD